jgi:hypothetical protein
MKRRSDDDGSSSGGGDRIPSSRSRSKIRSNNNRLGHGTIPPSPAEYAKILKKKKKAEEKAAKIANEAAIAAAEATVFAQKLDEAQAAVVIESEAVAAGVAAGAVLEESPQSIVDGNQPQPWHSLLDNNNEDDDKEQQQQHNVKKKRRSFWSPSWLKKSTKRNVAMDESFSPQAAVSPTDSEIAAAMDNAPTPTYDRPPPPPPPPMFHTPSATAGLLFGALVNRASAAK